MNYDEAIKIVQGLGQRYTENDKEYQEAVAVIEQALTELSAIKQRAEEKRNDGNTLLREIELIDYILEGEGK